MLNLLLETLATFEGVEYLINETKTRRLERYNIKKQPEMQREVETTELDLDLYVVFEDGKFRGTYNVKIHPGTSADELKKTITDGIYAAGFVRNEYFPLVQPSNYTPPTPQSHDLLQTLETLQTAFYANDIHTQGHLSYSEFFITRSDVRIINSHGVDVQYTTHRAFIETAVHWRDTPTTKEIEVSEAFRFGLDMENAADWLKDRVSELFASSKDKAIATGTPSVGDIPVLLSGECLRSFFNYFCSRAHAANIYQKLSTYKIGDNVQSGSTDCITLTIDPLLTGSPSALPYDRQGFPNQTHILIQDGVLQKYWGDVRFAHYLGVAPTGNAQNFRVTGGTATTKELKKAPHLHLVSFSDFHCDTVTGDFGSEIRLGYYFDGQKTTPVTGGSISGNMEKIAHTLRMTREELTLGTFRGPQMVQITGASISGVSSQSEAQ
ncbi:MAG: metallopeptidase TldD-related protein [Defluviitaleaceae bacterium]|nr:metallopeptidase TldD-related protein [Defluviitaleaceae bacterium]